MAVRLSKFFNEPQLETLQRLADFTIGMHHADIKVRKDGQDKFFEADWLRDVVPVLLQMIHDEPPCEHNWNVGSSAKRCYECGAFELLPSDQVTQEPERTTQVGLLGRKP